MGIFDFFRREKSDSRPLALPAGMKLPETAEARMRRMIREEFSQVAADNGDETFEEANDFDIESTDIEDMMSRYETVAMVHEEITSGEIEGGPGDGGDTDGDSSEHERTDGDGERSTEPAGKSERYRGTREKADKPASDGARRPDPRGTSDDGGRGKQGRERGKETGRPRAGGAVDEE